MKDGIIKGNGTSRLLKSMFPATYEDFRKIAGENGLPVDMLFNSSGWEQEPDFLSKASLLRDATAFGYGLPNTAVPDDVLNLLMISNGSSRTVQYNESVVLVRCASSDGLPAPGVDVSIDGKSSTTNFLGCAKIYVSPGTKTIKYTAAIGLAFVSGDMTVEAKKGEVSAAFALFDFQKSGDVIFTKTGYYGIAPHIKEIDVCVVGGGGGGMARGQNYGWGWAYGGAGGYVENKLGIKSDGKSVPYIVVGSKGIGGKKSDPSSESDPSGGGTSSFSYGSVSLTARGGGASPNAGTIAAPYGGSGVGGFSVSNKRYTSSGDSGEDGGDGKPAPVKYTHTYPNSTGQHKTTRAFGEPDGEMYAGSGATVSIAEGGSGSKGKPGYGGGEGSTSYGVSGENGKTPGSGGGGACVQNSNSVMNGGDGADGIVRVRWRS